MAKRTFKIREVTVDGVNLSAFVRDIDLSKVSDIDDDIALESLAGLKRMRPFTITGTFDDRPTCIVCQERYTPGPEGVAVATDADTGHRFGPVCPGCCTALTRPREA